ncbi:MULTISPECIES: small ribosomal subunit Rsm22 family protein [unclassified Sinorhizobium]|uniref:small ribosomal subunit Rsm22 family protein n=1 Tax=unclassified Sinorhizobium TaxID=2613772 RepID=UPI003523B756
MELPPALRQSIERMLEHQPLETLRRASARLSSRYRQEVRDGNFHIHDALAAKAYLATRLPATFAAIRAALEAVSEADTDFAPSSLLDLGAGPGSALWAATDCWPGVESAVMVEASAAIRDVGRTLSEALPVRTEWVEGNLVKGLPALAPADLVTLAYVLDEVAGADIPPIVSNLWALTRHMLVIVEPGTPAGWQRILAARSMLLNAGAHLIAPCAHNLGCPIAAPDWCHFSRRVARSRLHRLVKEGEVPWEDEKYIFLAASRSVVAPAAARVLAPPQVSSGMVRLKLCKTDGTAAEVLVTKRDGAAFKQARRSDWGDALGPTST